MLLVITVKDGVNLNIFVLETFKSETNKHLK